jgi:hypothetical protein
MELFDFIVKTGKGKNSMLDKEYINLIKNVVLNNDEENESRWETYNLIIKDLFNIDEGKYFQEIRYRLTDGENPNYVISDILSRYKESELTSLILFLKDRIEEYIEDDFFKRFFE